MTRHPCLLVLCLLLASLPSSAAIALVPGGGGTQQTTSGSTVTVTIATPGAGNALILLYGCNPNTGTIDATTKPSGGGITTWVKVIGSTTNRCAELWYGLNSSGSGTTVTIPLNGAVTGSGGIANISEWSGIVGSSPLDGTAAANPGTSATPTTASITISEAGSLIIAMERGAHAAFTSGPTNSFVALNTPAAISFQAAYYLPGVTNSYSTGWTFGGSAVFNTVIGAFKAAAGGATFPAAVLNNPLPTM